MILIAKGPGITGILAAALSLIKQLQHDSTAKEQTLGNPSSRLFRDATQKVSVL